MKGRYLLYIACLAGAIIYFFATSPGSSSNAGKTTNKKKAASVATDVDLTTYDGPAFAKPSAKVRDIFLPTSGIGGEGPSAENMDKVPGEIAGGESGWVYTAFAILNGHKMALLEGGPDGQSGYVQEGQKWKASRVLTIGQDSILFEDKDGIRQTVLRFMPKEEDSAGAATAATATASPPVAPASPMPGRLQGPIGPGGPVVMPGGVTVDASATAGGEGG